MVEKIFIACGVIIVVSTTAAWVLMMWKLLFQVFFGQ